MSSESKRGIKLEALGIEIPGGLEDALTSELARPDFSGYFEALETRAPDRSENLLGLAKAFAVPRVSGFKVGALAMGHSGRCYFGANMEFAELPLHASLHAEQSAILNAWMHGEPSIRSLIVSELPCGHCRQFLLELHDASELPILVQGISTPLRELMPKPFGAPRAAGEGLLDRPACPVTPLSDGNDGGLNPAVEAAGKSYTPYSRSLEGFVLEMSSGQKFAGRTAESIAFNPSVTPVVAALNQLNLSSRRMESIVRCTHAKLEEAKVHSLKFSEEIMRGICAQPVECVLFKVAD